MIFFAEKQLGKPLPEPLDVQVALENARVTNRNLAALLRHDQGDRIRLLGEAQAGPVTKADGPVEILALGQGENAPGRLNTVSAEDHTPVVEHGLGMEDGQEEFLGETRVQPHPALGHGLEADIAFERDQGTEPLAGEIEDGVGDLLDLLASAQGRGEEPVAAEFVQGAPEFRLEDHDESDCQEDGEAPQKPSEDRQVQQLGNHGEPQEYQGETDQDPGAMGAAEIEINVVEDRREDQDLES